MNSSTKTNIINIPTELLITVHTYPLDMQEYDKYLDQVWLYERWAKRMNKQIPTITHRVFNLRDKSYVGHGFHYGMERKLGNLIAQLNNYDDCPRPTKEMAIHHITLKVVAQQLFKNVARAEKSLKRVD